MPTPPDPTSARRIELILEQVEALPTLPAVAMRLLQITSDDESDAREVIDTVRADPSLTAKILSLCKGAAEGGVNVTTLTIDKAVVLLGFEAIRNAVLSIKVFEQFNGDEPTEEDELTRFSRPAFWRHCLATAICCELVAAAHGGQEELNPAEAFVCGLLHGIGKLALEHVLPKSYQRVIELTEQTQGNIADVERRVIGIDHHTAGKRLAEKWNLPHTLCDSMWLYESPARSLPDVPHRRLVGLVGLGEAVVRAQHIGYSGNYLVVDDIDERAEALGLEPAKVRDAAETVMEQLEQRGAALGLGETPSRELFMESIMQANAVLGRLNSRLETHRRQAARQTKAIDAIRNFHANAASSARSVGDVLSTVVASAASVLGDGQYAIIYQPTGQSNWQISRHTHEGRITANHLVEPPPQVGQLSVLARREDLPISLMGVMPWLSDYLVGFDDLRRVKLMPLPCAWGTAAVLVHDRDALPAKDQLKALTYTWGAAIGAATQHEGARRMSEQLAEANRVLTETQDTLLRNQSLARLGEMAAGAAHEMNNPLAVISGRSQLLAMQLPKATKEQQAAAQVYEQSQKLSDMITALHLFAEPPEPRYEQVGMVDVMQDAVSIVRKRNPKLPALRFNPAMGLPLLHTDRQHVAQALAELMLNAYEASPTQTVRVLAQVDPLDDRLVIKVTDDGPGMDAHTLKHAFDPFFSSKPAGRQPGLGLARAQRLIEAIDGRIELASQPGEGTTASIRLPVGKVKDEVGGSASGTAATPEANGEGRVIHADP